MSDAARGQREESYSHLFLKVSSFQSFARGRSIERWKHGTIRDERSCLRTSLRNLSSNSWVVKLYATHFSTIDFRSKKFIESCRNLGIDPESKKQSCGNNGCGNFNDNNNNAIVRELERWMLVQNIIARLTRLFNLEKWDFKEVQRVGNDAWMRSPRMEDRKKREGKKNGGIRMR